MCLEEKLHYKFPRFSPPSCSPIIFIIKGSSFRAYLKEHLKMIHRQTQIIVLPVFFYPVWLIVAQRKTSFSWGALAQTGDSLLMDVNVVDTTENIPSGVQLQLIDNRKDAH